MVPVRAPLTQKAARYAMSSVIKGLVVVLAVLGPLDVDVLAVLAVLAVVVGSGVLQMSQNCNVGVPLTLT
jgi:hypothetical protein